MSKTSGAIADSLRPGSKNMHRYRHLALKTDDGGPHGVLPLAVGLFLGPETLGHPRFSISWSKKLHFPTLFGRYWSTPSRIALSDSFWSRLVDVVAAMTLISHATYYNLTASTNIDQKESEDAIF